MGGPANLAPEIWSGGGLALSRAWRGVINPVYYLGAADGSWFEDKGAALEQRFALLR